MGGKKTTITKHLSFENVSLLSLVFKTYNEAKNPGGDVQLKLSIDHEVEEKNGPRILAYYYVLKINAFDSSDEEKNKIFEFESKHKATYKFTDENKNKWTDEDYDFFASTNVMMHVWPFVRELVHRTTKDYSGASPLLLPMMPIKQ